MIVFGARSHRANVTELAAAAFQHFEAVLGAPSSSRLAVYVVSVDGPVRGFAGQGFVVVDASEVRGDNDCTRFLSSAGTKGTCLPWVLGHEIAHQWFGHTALIGEPEDLVAWESLADYMAFDWWRSVSGLHRDPQMVRRMVRERMDLDPNFAESHAPGRITGRINDQEERALLRGRGSGAWLVIDAQLGRDTATSAARRVITDFRSVRLSARSVVDIVKAVSPEAGATLEQWWFSRSFTAVEWESR